MHSLEDWIKQLLVQPFDDLNSKYYYPEDDTARKEVESLPGVDPMRYGSSRVSAHIIRELHQKIRGHKCEVRVWDAIIFHLHEPLPTQVAHDLIDRDIIVDQLGHTRQDDEVQWRLASLVDEALLTLFWDLYTQPIYEVAAVQKLLSQHPDHGWLLDKWEHWAHASSSREKEIAFYKWAWEHPERPDSLPNPEQYLEMLAAREREEQEERLRVKREAEERCLELERIANSMLNPEEIQLILLIKEPDELLALAGNPQVPIQWIQKLITCHHVKGARQIREAAEKNIKAR